MKGLAKLALLCFPLAFSSPLRRIHLRQLPPAVQITWVTTSTTVSIEATTTVFNVAKNDAVESSPSSSQPDNNPTPFLWQPALPSISAAVSVSTATVTMTVSGTLTSTIHEQPDTVTVTAIPTTVTNTVTVSETFTATPGSFWSAPAKFSNLDSFKVAHFACGEKNLKITSDTPPDDFNVSLAVNLPLFNNDIQASQDQDVFNASSFNASSTVLQLFYPEDSINPGNSPQGGADFYATPVPLTDASNVTLEYSVFFPADFDWVRGGKLPGLYGGHMTCSGGDDATSCFSTRLMWREEGAGELYLYAPKDKQSYALCHAPPFSVCDAAYGLSIGRGSFKFSRGAWTKVRQTVVLNTPGEHDGSFRLDVDDKLIMDRHDVFYRDVPTATASSSSAPAATSSGGGGLLSPLLGGVLKPVDGAGVNEGILPPFGRVENTSPSTKPISRTTDSPPLLPFEQPFGALQTTLSATPSAVGAVQPTLSQTAQQSTVTVTNYLWDHAFDITGKQKAVQGLDDDDDDDNPPKPVAFSGLFFSTFFGGSSHEYATPRDQYTWFKEFSITINS